MNSATNKSLDLLKDYPEIKDSQIILSHRGLLTDKMLTEMSRNLRKQVSKKSKNWQKNICCFYGSGSECIILFQRRA